MFRVPCYGIEIFCYWNNNFIYYLNKVTASLKVKPSLVKAIYYLT